MDFNDLQKEIHDNAVSHGWWEEERSFGEVIALCHSELSEALEEYRDGKEAIYYNCKNKCHNCKNCKTLKPEGIAIELADAVIRIMDYCEHAGIDLWEAIQIKHEYNKGRPYKHGGKII